MSHQQLTQHLLPQNSTASNRFIYVKHNFINPNPTNKVLINPHFSKKVFVNPKFNPPPETNKPKIHINPDVLKNFAASVNNVMAMKTSNSIPEKKSTTVISTKNKLIRVPVGEKKSTAVISTRNKLIRVPVAEKKSTTVIFTRNKLIRVPVGEKKSTAVISTRNKLIRVPAVGRKRQSLLHTKYKIVRPTASRLDEKKTKLVKNSRFKLLNVSYTRSPKKKYVFVNRFLSMDVIAKNVLLKKNANVTKPGFVRINGTLYRKSPNSLKRASDSPPARISRNKIIRGKQRPFQITKHQLNRCSSSKPLSRESVLLRFRSKKRTPGKLSKCNMPCLIYRKTGRCPGMSDGSCIKVHNPEQIVLCPRFLQGACVNERCPLSHKVSQEKMPTCKYYLHGLCSKDDCAYLHVKISPKADICRDFLEGFCRKGAQCDKRHQFLCPEFEKTKKCVKRRCPYPHGNIKKGNSILINSLIKRRPSKKIKAKSVEDSGTSESNRYYKDFDAKDALTDLKSSEEPIINTLSRDRPKLGTLPAFIPLFDST